MTGVRKDIFKNIQENRTQVSMKVGITPIFKLLKIYTHIIIKRYTTFKIVEIILNFSERTQMTSFVNSLKKLLLHCKIGNWKTFIVNN